MKRALIIGISDYSATPYTSLGLADADARAVAEALELEQFGFDAELLLNGDATKRRITQALVDLINARPSSVLLYFAGHGVATPFGSFLATADAAEHDWGVDMSRAIQAAAGAADESVIILDCCHAGDAQFTRDAPAGMLAPVSDSHLRAAFDLAPRSKALLAACQSHELATEQFALGHGLFTYYLLEGLLGQAADHQGKVAVASLFDYVSAHFMEETGQTPLLRSDLVGRMILGEGFKPVLAPPLPEDEAHEVEDFAEKRVDAYNRGLAVSAEEWRATHYREACDTLDDTLQWFEKQIAKYPALLKRDRFQAAHKSALTRQSHLGQIEAGTRLREGIATRTLGQGEFGTVWRVEVDASSSYSTDLAYKIYHPSQLHQLDKVQRFRRGFDAMLRLDHPNVVPVFRYTSAPLGFFMRYIDGPNLRELSPAGTLEPSEIVTLLLSVVSAVGHAHARDVIHRDIKPENVVCLVDAGSWTPHLTDFDLAWFSTATRITKAAMGTPVYAAPEQTFLYSSSAKVSRSPSLDVYSLGQLLFFAVTGSDPLPLDTEKNVETLSARIAHWPSGEAAAETVALYRDAAQVKPGDRLGDVATFDSRLSLIRMRLSHESLAARLTLDAFARELAFACTGQFPSESFGGSVWSASGQTLIRLVVRAIGQNRYALSAHLEPGGPVGLEGLTGDEMRRRMNLRIDKTLRDYPTAHRRSGTSGVYTVYIDLDRVSPDTAGVARARDVLSRVLHVLESA